MLPIARGGGGGEVGVGVCVGGGSFMSREELCGKTQKRVYLWCRRAFWGRQGSGKTPLEDQKHSQNHPEGNRMVTAIWEKKAKILPINPPSLRLSESLFIFDSGDPPSCLRDIKQIQLGENKGGRGGLGVPEIQFMYNKRSHGKRKNKRVCSVDSREKVPETTFCRKRG